MTRARWLPVLLLVACGPSSAVSTGTETEGEMSSSSSGGEEACDVAWADAAPALANEVMVPHVYRVVAGPDGATYGVGTRGGDDLDVVVQKFDADGEVAWTARWGSPLGWHDFGLDVATGLDGVLVAGRAASYDSQEYWYSGHAFVRAYSHGGVLKWSWEDHGTQMSSDVFRPRMLAAASDGVYVAIPTYQDAEAVRVVRLSAQGALEAEWTVALDQRRARLLAVQVDDTDGLWVLVDGYRPWLGHYGRNGEQLEVFDLGDETEVSWTAGAVERDGSVGVAGEAFDGSFVISRFAPGLTDPREHRVAVDDGIWPYTLELGVTCDGSTWVASPPEIPVMMFDDGLNERWRGEAAESFAPSSDGRSMVTSAARVGGAVVRRYVW